MLFLYHKLPRFSVAMGFLAFSIAIFPFYAIIM